MRFRSVIGPLSEGCEMCCPTLLIFDGWLFTVLRPAQEFLTYMFNSGLQNLGLCSALRAFEQGGIVIVPHLLWHVTSVFPVSSEWPPHWVAFYDTRRGVEDLF
jgi:hypothetical protein